MWTYTLVAIAAIFNLVMDTLTWWKDRSVFKDLDDKWWNPNVSWMHVPNFLGWMRFDAWHIAKMVVVISLISAAACAYKLGLPFGWWSIPIMYFEWGAVWELTRKLTERK